MTPKRIEQLSAMTDRGTIRKGHVYEMLNAIKELREALEPLTEGFAYLEGKHANAARKALGKKTYNEQGQQEAR